jgi:hypothetical protein
MVSVTMGRTRSTYFTPSLSTITLSKSGLPPALPTRMERKRFITYTVRMLTEKTSSTLMANLRVLTMVDSLQKEWTFMITLEGEHNRTCYFICQRWA